MSPDDGVWLVRIFDGIGEQVVEVYAASCEEAVRAAERRSGVRRVIAAAPKGEKV